MRVTDIVVKRSRIVLTVQLTPGAPRATTRELANRLVAAVPSLSRHACVNDVGPTFGDIMARTTIPHVLEHLIIDAQVRQAPRTDATVYVGTTEWANEAAGIARIQVSYADDVAALRAVRDATELLNGLLGDSGAGAR